MDAAIIFAAAITAACIIGAFIMMSRRDGETGEDSTDLVNLAEEKAKAEADLASTRVDLETTQQQLHAARQFEIRNARLETDLENEKALQKRTAEELQTTQARRDQLQSDVQKLTADVSKLETELKNRKEGEKTLVDRFNTVSSETLANQQKHFLERATETLKPLSQKVDKLDREWATTSGAFKQQIESLATETRTLSTALTRPQARGQWGEMQVERALELSGLVKGIHYDTQTSDNQGGRTDFIVHMPHRRDIILDSKVSLIALIEAQDTTDDGERSAHLDRHARHMQEHADSLAGKEYWSQLPDSADFVVMVVPEFALPPAVERRPNLIDRALCKTTSSSVPTQRSWHS